MDKKYGFGISIRESDVTSIQNLLDLLTLAPIYGERCMEVLRWNCTGGKIPADLSINEAVILLERYGREPTADERSKGIPEILRSVIAEVENIHFCATTDSVSDQTILVYLPGFPWEIPEAERNVTEDNLRELLRRYVGVLSKEKSKRIGFITFY